jgi:hypothetical protein
MRSQTRVHHGALEPGAASQGETSLGAAGRGVSMNKMKQVVYENRSWTGWESQMAIEISEAKGEAEV